LAPLGTGLKLGAAPELVLTVETCAPVNEAQANINARLQAKLNDRFLMLMIKKLLKEKIESGQHTSSVAAVGKRFLGKRLRA
jgi:hypothetical protein